MEKKVNKPKKPTQFVAGDTIYEYDLTQDMLTTIDIEQLKLKMKSPKDKLELYSEYGETRLYLVAGENETDESFAVKLEAYEHELAEWKAYRKKQLEAQLAALDEGEET